MMTGQKAIHLQKLREAGIPVPDFSVIPHENFRGGHTDLSGLPVLLDHDCDRFAVRSSASAEDSDSASFAGQFRTFLNVPKEEIESKVRLCFASLQSDNIKQYALKNGLNPDDLKMDVIVQRMVNPELAGVIFTSNPQGLLNETVITVGKGLGENVVSEKAETTSYYYSATDRLYYYDGNENLLSDALVEGLIGVSEKIKSILGDYLDIEFAVEKGEIFILQARKITTLSGDSPLVLDNSNIVESYPGLSLPLTVSFVHTVYSGVFRSLCRRIVRNEKVIGQKQDVYNNMVGHVNGRLYYKISNWYAVLRLLPLSKKIIPVWQEMLGVKARSYTGEDVKVPLRVRAMSYLHCVTELFGAPKNMEKLYRDFRVIHDGFYARFSESMTSGELHGIYDDIRQKLFGVWDVTLVNDMYAFLFTALLKSRLKKRGRTDDQINAFISGISDIESMKPMKALIDIAFHRDEMSAAEYEAAKADYIKEFGDRSLEELKLESRTFRTSPELFDERIEFYRADREKLAQMYADLQRHGTAKEEKYDFITNFLRKRASLGIRNREISRLNRSRAYGIVRQIFLTIGKHAAEDGRIGERRDIFYLTVEEAFDIPADAKELIERRKEQYSLFARLPAYTRLIFENAEFDKNHACVNSFRKRLSDNRLSGTPCSFGVAEGEARVITDVSSVGDVRGKILVTRMTDPGWVFLLAAAKGVISEKGSLLSHTAIISRELKIPSIVGVEGLLDTVRDGDRIRMDGRTGEIIILREEKE
ncbi:MAG: phosphoenolpyruvate synthase [Clostridia bacterium]|nr:phosphoenolpyruvate synthase [Clostridia bacterium]